MMKARLKNILLIIGLLVIAFFVESFFQDAGIPITIIDLVVTPFACFLIIYGAYKVYSGRKKKKVFLSGRKSKSKLLTVSVSLIFALIGFFSMLISYDQPLTFFTGVKGNAHGYTVFMLGLVVSLYSVYMGYTAIKNK